eukprot:3072174-Pyramimonas_sp.AAC.1
MDTRKYLKTPRGVEAAGQEQHWNDVQGCRRPPGRHRQPASCDVLDLKFSTEVIINVSDAKVIA